MKKYFVAACGIGCVFLSGCYQKESDQNGIVVSFQVWVPILVAVAGITAVPIGILLCLRKVLAWGIILTIGGLAAAGVIAPMMFQDRVVINQEGFYSRHGFWWSPTVHDIHYADLLSVDVGYEVQTNRRGQSYSYHFNCIFKNGTRDRVPLGDIMRQALPEIAEQFRKHGVPVHIPPDLPG